MAHTSAPWQRFDNGGVLYVRTDGTEDTYGPNYADVVWGPEGPGHGVIADCSPYGQAPSETTIANARVIAEAPALLDDLESILIHLSMGWELDVLLETALATVKRARG